MAWSDPHVLIIGAGAVGSFIAARLGLAGARVTLVGRPVLVEAARTTGLLLVESGGERRTVPLAAFTSLEEAFDTGSFDLAILTVKAYDTAAVIDELAHITPRPPALLTLQNGVGNEEALAAAFGASRIISGAIDTPLSLGAGGVVTAHRMRFRAGLAPVTPDAAVSGGLPAVPQKDGPRPVQPGESGGRDGYSTHAGIAGPAPANPAGEEAGGRDADVETLGVAVFEQTVRLLIAAGLRVDAFDDHRRLKWSKLLLNLPANATCAILDRTPAEVMSHPATAGMEARAWQEAFRVMAGLKIRPVRLASYPLPILATVVPALPPAWLGRVLARIVAGGRGGKMPSFHVALSAGKRSEIAWLNGAVAAAGQRLGIPTPANAALTRILTALTDDSRLRPAWAGQFERLAGESR